MFFKKKSKTLDLIYKENIKVGCQNDTQENVIKQLGQMLVDTGYVKPDYINGMLEREKTFSTFMGCDLALPHGVDSAKKEVISSGVAVMTFKDGILWGEDTIKIAVGIAGVGNEHLDILSQISEIMMEEADAEKLVNGDVNTIYNLLSRKG